jgi:hypothetical protein
MKPLKEWKSLISRIKELNEAGYEDGFNENLNCSIGFVNEPKNLKYAILLVDDDREISLSVFETKDDAELCLLELGTDWKANSVWCDDKEVEFEIIATIKD